MAERQKIRREADDGRRTRDRATLESPLSATWQPRVRERAVLVGVGPGISEADLDELDALADSAGADAVSRIVQSRREPDPGTFIGRGKLEELHRTVHRLGAGSVILDQELTPGQLRSLEDDRREVIDARRDPRHLRHACEEPWAGAGRARHLKDCCPIRAGPLR